MTRFIRSAVCASLGWAALWVLPTGAQTRVISTIARYPSSLSPLVGVATDGAGNTFYSAAAENIVLRLAPNGLIQLMAGGPNIAGSADGTGAAATFRTPCGLAVDSGGNLYVADRYNHTIRKITPSGGVTTVAGVVGIIGNGDGPAGFATFNNPYAVAVGSNGDIYVADNGNRAVRKISAAGVVTTLAVLPNGGYPAGIAVNGLGTIFVSEAPNLGGGAGAGPNQIDQISSGGVITTVAGQFAAGSADGIGGAARFNQPRGLALDPTGNLYVADAGNGTIREITPAGLVSTVAGAPGSTDLSNVPDGTGAQARFSAPNGVTVGADGNLYVADVLGLRRGILASNTQGAVRFANVSARGTVADSSPLIAGFVVLGSVPETMLVRAVGPTLAEFGVSAPLAKPLLQIYGQSGQVIASSADGQNLDNIDSARKLVGAFPFSIAVSGDVGIVLTLPPGVYTSGVTGPAGSSGTVLLEVYEVP